MIRLSAGEHEVNGTNQLVGQGDDGFLVPASHYKPLIFRPEHRQGTSGCIGCFAEQGTKKDVALTRFATFTFASTFVVARTQGGPGGQTGSAAEVAHG